MCGHLTQTGPCQFLICQHILFVLLSKYSQGTTCQLFYSHCPNPGHCNTPLGCPNGLPFFCSCHIEIHKAVQLIIKKRKSNHSRLSNAFLPHLKSQMVSVASKFNLFGPLAIFLVLSLKSSLLLTCSGHTVPEHLKHTSTTGHLHLLLLQPEMLSIPQLPGSHPGLSRLKCHPLREATSDQ